MSIGISNSDATRRAWDANGTPGLTSGVVNLALFLKAHNITLTVGSAIVTIDDADTTAWDKEQAQIRKELLTICGEKKDIKLKLAAILQKLKAILGEAQFSVLLEALNGKTIDLGKLLSLDINKSPLEIVKELIAALGLNLASEQFQLDVYSNLQVFTPETLSGITDPSTIQERNIAYKTLIEIYNTTPERLAPSVREKIKLAKEKVDELNGKAEQARAQVEGLGRELAQCNTLVDLKSLESRATEARIDLTAKRASLVSALRARLTNNPLADVSDAEVALFVDELAKTSPREQVFQFENLGNKYTVIAEQRLGEDGIEYHPLLNDPGVLGDLKEYVIYKDGSSWIFRQHGWAYDSNNTDIAIKPINTAGSAPLTLSANVDPAFARLITEGRYSVVNPEQRQALLAGGSIVINNQDVSFADGISNAEAHALGFSDTATAFWSNADGNISATDIREVFDRHIDRLTQGLDPSARQKVVESYITTTAGFILLSVGQAADRLLAGRSSIGAEALIGQVNQGSQETARHIVYNVLGQTYNLGLPFSKEITLSRDQIVAFMAAISIAAQMHIEGYSVDRSNLHDVDVLESPEDFLSWLKTGKVQTAEVAEPSGPVSGSKGVLSQEAKRSIQELDRSETKRNPTNRRQIAVGIMRSLASNPEQLEAFWTERTNPGAGYVELLPTDPEAINILFKSYTSSEELYQKAFEMLQALPNDETKYQFLAQLASKCFASKTLATRQMAVTVLTALDEASKGAYQVDPQLRGSFASGGIEERDPNGTEPLATLIGLINKSLEIPNEVWLTQRLLFSTKPDNRGDKIIELRGLDDIEARLIEEKGKLETFIAANKTGIHNIRARIVLGRIIRELALKQGRDPALYAQAMEQFRSAWNLYYKSMEEARESARLGKTTASIGLQTEGLQEAFTEMALTVTMARRDANKPLSKQLAAYIPDYDGREALVKKATYFESDREVRRTGGEDQITPKDFRKKADAVGIDKGKELGIAIGAGIPIPSRPPQQGKAVASKGQAQRRDATGSRPQAGSPAALPSQAPAPTSDEADAAVRGADEALE